MFKLWKFTLYFLLCMVVALLFNLPIPRLLPHLNLPDTVRLDSINGTVFRGTARKITINKFPLQSIEFRFLPSCVPLLKICYWISYEQGKLQLAYDVLNGHVEISKGRVEYQAAELAMYIPNALIKPAGRLEFDINELTLIEGKPVTVNGKLVWRDLGLDDDGTKAGVGDYQVDFVGDQQTYDFKIGDLDADLDVTGKAEVSADGRYTVDLRISSDIKIDPNIKTVLDLAAAKLGYNKYRVEQKGRLPENITRQLFYRPIL